jgi:hypothetical protein
VKDSKNHFLMIDEIKMRLKKSARPSKRKNDKPFASDCTLTSGRPSLARLGLLYTHQPLIKIRHSLVGLNIAATDPSLPAISTPRKTRSESSGKMAIMARMMGDRHRERRPTYRQEKKRPCIGRATNDS